MGIDNVTIVLVILLLLMFLGHCVLDWIELRDERWEMISYEPEEEDGKEGEGENNKL